jgi:hypothetical protein
MEWVQTWSGSCEEEKVGFSTLTGTSLLSRSRVMAPLRLAHASTSFYCVWNSRRLASILASFFLDWSLFQPSLLVPRPVTWLRALLEGAPSSLLWFPGRSSSAHRRTSIWLVSSPVFHHYSRSVLCGGYMSFGWHITGRLSPDVSWSPLTRTG